MALILGGKLVDVPGVETVSWLDDPKRVPRATDTQERRSWIRAIVLHTVHGKRGPLAQGLKPSKRDETYAKYQANTSRDVSWDFTVDTDGSVAVSNDPVHEYTWQAGQVNSYTLGIELVQEQDGTLYTGQLDATVRLIDVLTRELGIQRQVPVKNGKPCANVLTRLIRGHGSGANVCGIYGHRNATNNRGFGDPGDHPFDALLAAGYEGFDIEAGEDLKAWASRQHSLGFSDSRCDGVPGPQTHAMMRARQFPDGLWVKRP